MTDYISREAATRAVCCACSMEDDFHECVGYPQNSEWCEYMVSLRSIPDADVRENKRGRWQSWTQDRPPCKWYSCDYCGFHALSKSNYCPNCGAQMEG